MITPVLCCTEQRLLWQDAKSISSIVLVFEVSPYNPSSNQTSFPRGVSYNYSERRSGTQFHTSEKSSVSNSPLHWPVALLRVWFQEEARDCTAIQRESFISNQRLCLHTLEETTENLIGFSFTATKGKNERATVNTGDRPFPQLWQRGSSKYESRRAPRVRLLFLQ